MKDIPIAKIYLGREEKDLVAKVISSGWIAQGRMVKEFEDRAARYTGAKYAVAVSSGTAALHLALLISGIGEGDEVIVPSFSFIATANSVLYCGARAVFVDIDSKTYNIDPDKIGAAITRKTKAIMPVHQFGLACDLDAVSEIARRYNLAVIEDAACALGSLYKGRRIGSGSNIACFSFHPRKIITTGEGGMLVTGSRAHADKARALRNHGASLTAHEDYKVLGYNYRLTDLQAAVGIGQLSRLAAVLKKRKRLAERYDRAFENIKCVEIPRIPPYATPNYQSYVIKIRKSGISRDRLIERLSKDGIQTRRGNTAIHLQGLYKKRAPDAVLPNTEEAALRTIALPIYYEMSEKEQDFVIDRICHAK